ncbi:MAG: EVE domain-containing protein [Bacteroidia bacterium]
MNYWLLKSEPDTYSWDDLVRENRTMWEGVRNYQARNNLQEMKLGDLAFFYHSFDKEIVGICKVVKEHFPDPTADDEKWVVVEVEPVKPVNRKVSLKEIKAEAKLKDLKLVTHSRLSVAEVSEAHFKHILKMTETKI